jgi:hypothetical protein
VNTSFKSLDQIVKSISTQVEKLNNGQLNVTEIESMCVNAQDLYERLIIIRHKAFENLNISDGQSQKEKPTELIPETLIDKKEETALVNNTDKTDVLEDSVDLLFDFSSEPEVEIKTEQKQQTIEVDNTSASKPNTIKGTINDTFESKNSLNDVFKTNAQKSLADKLKFSPIKDLKSKIDINSKFIFIRELFKGDSDAYQNIINTLNNFESGDDARAMLTKLSETYNWDVENENVIAFVELVERRYL